MSYDSTLGYADRVGFRCGTCFEYPAFDPVEQKVLKLHIRPLIVMDCTLIDKEYMGLGFSDYAKIKLLQLKNHCMTLGGNFSMLWHNSYFMNQESPDFYKSLMN